MDVCYVNYDPSTNRHSDLSEHGTQLHVTFDSHFVINGSDEHVVRPTEMLLRKIFIKFGTLIDVSVKEYTMKPVSSPSLS